MSPVLLVPIVGTVGILVGAMYVHSRIRLVADQYGTLITNRRYRREQT